MFYYAHISVNISKDNLFSNNDEFFIITIQIILSIDNKEIKLYLHYGFCNSKSFTYNFCS